MNSRYLGGLVTGENLKSKADISKESEGHIERENCLKYLLFRYKEMAVRRQVGQHIYREVPQTRGWWRVG
jgi:hypothetical protein